MKNVHRLIYSARQCLPVRRFDGYQLLRPLNLSIAQGEWITLIGHNGSGKSSLARFIAGYQRSELQIEGEENRFGYDQFPIITQLTSQYLIGSTPYEDLMISCEQYGKVKTQAEAEQQIDELLLTLKLQHLKHVPLSQLSGGEKQLVAVAGALLMDSKLIVLDEVTSMLSEHNKWHVCRLIRSLAVTYQIAVIWITQQLDELQANDTVWVMDELQQIYNGKAGALFFRSMEEESSQAQKLSLDIPWSVHKSLSLGMSAEELHFNPYSLAEVVKGDANATQ